MTGARHVAKHRPRRPVEVRRVFDDLVPALRAVALKVSGGDRSRVVVLSPSRFEVTDRR